MSICLYSWTLCRIVGARHAVPYGRKEIKVSFEKTTDSHVAQRRAPTTAAGI
ncbi:MAG TPA: hypothetical protein VIW64_11870 [Pyrinomonadaceae bacterium]